MYLNLVKRKKFDAIDLTMKTQQFIEYLRGIIVQENEMMFIIK